MSSSIKKIVQRIARKTMVRSVACPKCGAKPGNNCVGLRTKCGVTHKTRVADHQERWEAFHAKNKE